MKIEFIKIIGLRGEEILHQKVEDCDGLELNFYNNAIEVITYFKEDDDYYDIIYKYNIKNLLFSKKPYMKKIYFKKMLKYFFTNFRKKNKK